jgi:hypothetical protein
MDKQALVNSLKAAGEEGAGAPQIQGGLRPVF